MSLDVYKILDKNYRFVPHHRGAKFIEEFVKVYDSHLNKTQITDQMRLDRLNTYTAALHE
jgi:hypothetical protein